MVVSKGRLASYCWDQRLSEGASLIPTASPGNLPMALSTRPFLRLALPCSGWVPDPGNYTLSLQWIHCRSAPHPDLGSSCWHLQMLKSVH